VRIFILDEICVKPGLAAVYRRTYRDRYVPGAERRGMRLEGAWQNPPGQDYHEISTTLYYLWSVESVNAWWAMRMSRKPDGEDERFDKLAWWQESDTMTLSRERTLLTAQLDDC
jgi:hypothetical protein